MSLGERLREMLDPGATAVPPAANGSGAPGGLPPPTRRRPRSQAQPVNPMRSYDVEPTHGQMPRAQWIGLGLAAALAVALTAGLVFFILTIVRPSTQTATPTPLPVVASPTAAASVAQIFATSTPPANAPAPPSAPPPPAAGQRVQVANTGNDGANLRRDPGQAGEKIKTIPDGTLVELVGPDRTVDGVVWRNVRDLQGESGWIAGGYLAAEGSVPAAGIPGSNLGPSGAPSTTSAAPAAPAAPRPTTAVAASTAGRGQVGNTNGQGANIRSEPGPNGRILKTLNEGANIDVVGPDREVDGVIWRQVRDSSGVTGWIVRGAVAPAGSVATPVPAAAPRATSAPSGGTTAAPAAKPSTGSSGSGTAPSSGSGTAPSSGGSSSGPAPTAKPTTPAGDLPIIIMPATPRPQGTQTAPRPTAQGSSGSGASPARTPTKTP